MARANHTEQTMLGDVVLARLAGVGVPAVLKPYLAAFKKEHAALRAAAANADKARTVRDDALTVINRADAVLDALVLTLADALVGARLGPRRNPFAKFSSYPPSRIVNLAYAVEVKEVRSLCRKVRQGKPPAAIAKMLSTCESAAKAVESSLGKLSKPQLAYQEALGKRETVVIAWSQAFARFKTNAQAAWFDVPATYKALFAPPEPVQARRAPRRAKAKAAASAEQPGGAKPDGASAVGGASA